MKSGTLSKEEKAREEQRKGRGENCMRFQGDEKRYVFEWSDSSGAGEKRFRERERKEDSGGSAATVG